MPTPPLLPDFPMLSVVVPAYNEADRIADTIARLAAELTRLVARWEILVADDGSRDGTADRVRAAAADEPRVRLLALPHAGKGAAVRAGLLAARGQWRFMADADLAMPPDNIERLLRAAMERPSSAIVIGSREAPGSRRIGEPRRRHLIGRAFNWLVRAVAVPGVRDTQCGYKLFSEASIQAIGPHLTVDGFAFDVELLALAQRAGLDVHEVGITWHGSRDSRVGIVRGAAAFLDVVWIRWRLWRGAYAAAPVDAAQAIARVGPLSVRSWAYLLAAVTAAAIGHDLLRIPVQVFDALEEILAAHRSPSVGASFWNAAYNTAYLRPLRIAQIKWLFDASGGNYWLAYRGFHVALITACLWLFTRALRVRSTTDLCAAAFALVVLTGLHTFRTLIQEAFPINHFLEIVVFALATLNLAQARPRATVDAAALVIFAAAALTLESGLLVWVVATAAWLVGLRGISWRGISLMTALLVAYFYARFVSLDVGVPGLVERSAGFGLRMLDPPELQEKFGARLWVFYAYNVAASVSSVLLSEPQSGVFVMTRAWIQQDIPLRYPVALVSSAVTTGLIVALGLSTLRTLRQADATARLVLVFGAVLAGNAVLSYAYTKDDIVSVAGVFYAIAAYAAVRNGLMRAPAARRLQAVMLAACLLVAGAGWSIRSMGLHHIAGSAAFKTRNDWAYQPMLWKASGRWPADPDAEAVIMNLRRAALATRAPNPRFAPSWADTVWGD